MDFKIKVNGLTVKYNSFPVLNGIEFEIRQGDKVALLGANGAGKSTLLRCLSRVLTPAEGVIYFEGREIKKYTARELAQNIAVVPQNMAINFDFTVEDVVVMGRFPYLSRFQKEQRKDREIARRAMEMTGVAHLSDRLIHTLSGGERQRAVIARALCQEPDLLLLDEPTANLDISYQTALLELAVKLNREKNITVITAIHDLNLATQFFDRFILLSEGKVLAAGNTEEVITRENIQSSYKVAAEVFRHPLHGRLQVSVPQKEKRADGKGPKFHVLGGGEEAVPVLEFLREQGCSISVGPVSTLDSSYRYARYHSLPVITVPPFSPVTSEAASRHALFIKKSDAVVVPPIPFGEENLPNLKAVERAFFEGIPVILINNESARERDYTGGRASFILKELENRKAETVERPGELLPYIQKLREKRPKGDRKIG